MPNITIEPVAGGQNFFDQFDAPAKPALDQRSRDLAIRTIYGEAAAEPDDGKLAVAAVIKNRLNTGKFGDSVPAVVLAPNQFEPWMRPDGRARMMALKPGTPEYDKIGSMVDQVFSDQAPDPTNGATHFYAPQAQAALGRQPPRWAANQQPLNIGRHAFYAPNGRATPPMNILPPQAQPGQTQPANFFDQFDQETQPQAPQPQAAPNPVAERFVEPPALANADKMQSALVQRGMELTQGPAQPPTAQMATAAANVLPAATQKTSPHASDYKQLLSTDVFEDDAGNLSFKDPQTGEIKKTNNARHVAIRDPADGVVKIYARSEATNESPIVGASRVLSAGLATGAPTARAMIPAAKNIQPAASDIMATAKPYYKQFDALAANGPPIAASEAKVMVDRVQNALDTAHLPAEVAKQVHDTVALIGKKGDTAISQLQYVKRAVGNLFKSPDENIRSGARVASQEISRMIADLSPEAAQNLKTADAIHSTARTVQDLQRKGAVADIRAGRAGYGGNTVNSMRQTLAPIVIKAAEGKVTGFKPDEIKALREIVEGNTATNTLRGIGQLSPSKGIIQTLGGAGAVIAAGPAGLLIPALGAASNKIATVLTGNQIEALKTLVAKRSPAYAEAVARAIDRYEAAQIELINQPTPARLAAAVSASRALSSGLQRDGIAVTSGDLLKRLQSPAQVAAEPDQNPVPGIPGQ